ncbi:hypothetical protein scyTo_0016538 [Scyliorhinus torazame]|uniref:Uncharacterized protein n=1 Tax=Scyliorhinus torazame TaxID=75743 RepID=A0A401PSY7_SCYTO|nr:hypothetical protein [Scyliorhinus torazame]
MLGRENECANISDAGFEDFKLIKVPGQALIITISIWDNKEESDYEEFDSSLEQANGLQAYYFIQLLKFA